MENERETKEELENLKRLYPKEWGEASKFIKARPAEFSSEKERQEFQMSNQAAREWAEIEFKNQIGIPTDSEGNRILDEDDEAFE